MVEWKEIKMKSLEFWRAFKREKLGLIGLGILILLVILAALAPFIADPNTMKEWRNPKYWEDNPQGVPPEWISIFTGKSYAKQEIKEPHLVKMENYSTTRVEYWEVKYDYQYDVPPSGIQIKLSTVIKNPANPPLLIIDFIRPDNEKLELLRKQVTSESLTLNLHLEESVKRAALSFARKCGDVEVEGKSLSEITAPMVMSILFSQKGTGMSNPGKAKPLKGEYIIEFMIIFNAPEEKVKSFEVRFLGRVYGLLGTDDTGRDLFSGIIWGIWVAMVIGLIASSVSVMIGVLYGVISAYASGIKSEILKRINDIFYVMPVLPILIAMAAAWKPSIWNIALLIALFGWPGTAVVVKSMALQIKEEPFIEAAKAVGASDAKIVFRHIMPQILPYAFATIALSVPTAILTEAGLSFLGLGDPTIPTWGQILHDANARLATVRGMWWWIIPPGFMIALVGLSFAFIGMALDKILNPKLVK